MFQKYGSPTCVTRIKVTPNMANPTSIKHSVNTLDKELKIAKEIFRYGFPRIFYNLQWKEDIVNLPIFADWNYSVIFDTILTNMTGDILMNARNYSSKQMHSPLTYFPIFQNLNNCFPLGTVCEPGVWAMLKLIAQDSTNKLLHIKRVSRNTDLYCSHTLHKVLRGRSQLGSEVLGWINFWWL